MASDSLQADQQNEILAPNVPSTSAPGIQKKKKKARRAKKKKKTLIINNAVSCSPAPNKVPCKAPVLNTSTNLLLAQTNMIINQSVSLNGPVGVQLVSNLIQSSLFVQQTESSLLEMQQTEENKLQKLLNLESRLPNGTFGSVFTVCKENDTFTCHICNFKMLKINIFEHAQNEEHVNTFNKLQALNNVTMYNSIENATEEKMGFIEPSTSTKNARIQDDVLVTATTNHLEALQAINADSVVNTALPSNTVIEENNTYVNVEVEVAKTVAQLDGGGYIRKKRPGSGHRRRRRAMYRRIKKGIKFVEVDIEGTKIKMFENLSVWMHYNCSVKSMSDQILNKLTMYQTEPENCEYYNAEWCKYWSRRCKELRSQNKNVDKNEIVVEWSTYWPLLIKTIMNNQLEDMKTDLRKTLGLPVNVFKDKLLQKCLTFVDDDYEDEVYKSICAKMNDKQQNLVTKDTVQRTEPIYNALLALDSSNALTDTELRVLLSNFKELNSMQQQQLIHYLKKIEATDPKQIEHLHECVSL